MDQLLGYPAQLPRYSGITRLVFAVGLLSLAGGFVMHSLPRAAEQDFAQYYWAVIHHQAGGSLYDATPVRGGINWLPPHFHLVIWPFVALGSLEVAYITWTLFSFLSVALVLRWSGASLGLATVVIWSAPVGSLLNGQTAAVVAVALTAAWRAATRRQSTQMGMWLATATLVKPFLAPLWLWPLFQRQWRAFAAGAATALSSLAVGAVIFGVDDLQRWVQQTDSALPWADHFLNSALAALVAHGIHPASLPIWWLLAASVLGLTVWVIATRRVELDGAWLLLVMAGLLASPLAWIYYWVFLLPMIAVRSRSCWESWQIVLLVGALWPLRWGLTGEASIYPVSLLLAWLMLALSYVAPASVTSAQILRTGWSVSNAPRSRVDQTPY